MLLLSLMKHTRALRQPSRLYSATPLLQVDLAHRLEGLNQPTVWHEFSPLAVQHEAVNLGQGFPDWEPPLFCIQAMEEAIRSGNNQYARSYAHLPLAKVLADIYSRRWNREIDAASQVATAVGCTNALYCALQGLLNPGDTCILLEPAFDIYSSQVKMAGGEPIYVPLRQRTDLKEAEASASDVFEINLDELEAAITDSTKVILLNTPHNPTGKMFTASELEGLAKIARKHDVVVISDEVYEHIVFDEPHLSMATYLPERTLTLSSSGKTFSATGWKVGWAVGPPNLVQAVTAMQQWVNFSAPTPNQAAMALCLTHAEQEYADPVSGRRFATFYEYLAEEYIRKRGLLLDALNVAGMKPITPPGGFFIVADTSNVDFPYEEYRTLQTPSMRYDEMPRDWALSRWMTEKVGVTAIPPSAFYCAENVGLAANTLRFAFCKSDATIKESHRRFEKQFGA